MMPTNKSKSAFVLIQMEIMYMLDTYFRIRIIVTCMYILFFLRNMYILFGIMWQHMGTHISEQIITYARISLSECPDAHVKSFFLRANQRALFNKSVPWAISQKAGYQKTRGLL